METKSLTTAKLAGIQIVGTERRGFSFAPIFEDIADIRTLADAQEFAKRVSKALNQYQGDAPCEKE